MKIIFCQKLSLWPYFSACTPWITYSFFTDMEGLKSNSIKTLYQLPLVYKTKLQLFGLVLKTLHNLVFASHLTHLSVMLTSLVTSQAHHARGCQCASVQTVLCPDILPLFFLDKSLLPFKNHSNIISCLKISQVSQAKLIISALVYLQHFIRDCVMLCIYI